LARRQCATGYLTNEEQAIEEGGSKNCIDASEIGGRLFKIIGDVIKIWLSRSRYARTGERAVRLKTIRPARSELAVHFITPSIPYSPERDPHARGWGRRLRA